MANKPKPRQTSFRQILGLGTSELRRDAEASPDLRRQIARLHGSSIPCSGVVHLVCGGCQAKRRVGFRCDGKCSLCPKKADERGAALARLLPQVPVRHWVLTLPTALREACAGDDFLTTRIARTFMGEVFSLTRTVVERERGELFVRGQTHCGGASLVHRAGSALNLNVHVHALALDGVYVDLPPDPDAPDPTDNESMTFLPIVDGPTEEDMEGLTERTLASVTEIVRRRRQTTEDLRPEQRERLRQASVRQALASGPTAETSARTVEVIPAAEATNVTPNDEPTGAAPRPTATNPTPAIEAERAGLRVCATAPVDGRERTQVLRLARYLTRPMVDLDALEPTADGKVRYTLERPFHDGTTHVEFEPKELAERLVSLLPNSQAHRIAYHGVLAPGAAKRWRVVPTQLMLIEEVHPRSPQAVRRTKVRKGEAQDETVQSAFACERCGEAMTIVGVEEGSDEPMDRRLVG